MLNKKWFLSFVTLSALTLAACGNGGNGGTDDGGGATDDGAAEEGEVLETEDGEEFEAPTTADGELNVWTFTDEAADMINNYYLEAFPDLDYEINISQVPTEEFETQLDPVLNTDSAPDVIFAEQAFFKKYVESGLLVDLDQFGNISENREDIYEYVTDAGTSEDGTFVMSSWQTTPGAFFYRADLASEHLGI
ncbi:extracellular solute-binding protein, partial [Alkalibacterium iburiense]